MAADQLLQRGYTLYPINPLAAKEYRRRKRPAAARPIARVPGAWADALRTDGHAWRALRPQDEATATLRVALPDEIGLIETRTALVNQLQATLSDTSAWRWTVSNDWVSPGSWAFVRTFPTAADLAKAGHAIWQNFLHSTSSGARKPRPNDWKRWARASSFNASAATVMLRALLA